MNTNSRLVVLIATVLVLTGCASTRVTETWSRPGQSALDFEKVLVVAFAPTPDMRRMAENEIVDTADEFPLVAAHTLFPPGEVKNRDAARARVLADGFDGAVTVHLVALEEQTHQVPIGGGHDDPFWGYYGNVWVAGRGLPPAEYRTTRTLILETRIYDLASGELLWSAQTETFNPQGVESAAHEVARAVVAELKRQKLVD